MLQSRNLSYFFSLIPGIAAIAGNLSGGLWALSNVILSFGLFTILEVILGSNTSNAHSSKKEVLPDLLLYLHVLLHCLVLTSFFSSISNHTLQGGYIAGAMISCGLVSGTGAIIVAHELIHKNTILKRFLGQFLLLSVGNIYFYIHHLRVHHRYVGTANDAATAKRGETVYGFFIRTLLGQIIQAWRSEHKLHSSKNTFTAFWQNLVLRNFLICWVLALACYFFLGGIALAAWLGICAVANFLLEYVNYIEHYGLSREPTEKFGHAHSWNSDKVISRFVLIDLSRHADHHIHASKSYHTLASNTLAPTLPGGYFAALIPVLIPFWWFKIVHPILDSYKKQG